MNAGTLIPILTLMVSAIGVLVAAAAFVRVGKWRDSDDGKSINTDIHNIKNHITKIDLRLGTAEKSSNQISELSGRIKGVETSLGFMASRADIEGLKSEVDGLSEVSRHTQAAVGRIETWLIERKG